MYIKRYTIASFLLIAFVGWFVFAYVTQGSMSINFFGIKLPSLSTALWVIVPMVLLYIASVFHMSFYSFLGSLKLRKYEKDYEKIIDAICEAFLGKQQRHHSYKTPRYKLLGSVIDGSTLFPTDKLGKVDNEKLDEVIKIINDIKNGDVVDLKKYNLKHSNQLVIQNNKNRFKKGELKAEDILNNHTKYDKSFCEYVYGEYVKTATLKNIQKYQDFLTKESFFAILSRINKDENKLDVQNDDLLQLFKKVDLDKDGLVEASRVLSKNMIPDQRIKLFEIMSEHSDKGMYAYLFTLFDLEMLSPANEILENTQDNEYQNFKAYSALKECGKQYSLELFI